VPLSDALSTVTIQKPASGSTVDVLSFVDGSGFAAVFLSGVIEAGCGHLSGLFARCM